MDAFAAIEELTRKMQRVVVVPSDTAVNEKGGRESDEQVAPLRKKKRSSREMRGDRRASDGDEVEVHEHHGATMADADDGDDTSSGHDEQNAHHKDEDEEATVRASGECERTTVGKGSNVVKATGETTSSATTMAEEEESEKAATANDTSAPAIAAAAAAAEDEEDAEASNDRNLSALSLIQRIGNVTISSDRSSSNEEHAGSTSTAAADSNASSSATNETSSHTDTHPGLQSPPSSRSPTSSSSSPSLFTRKRRGAFGPFGMADGKDGSHRQSSSSNSNFKEHSGPSTLPLFPSSKKQKLMVEVGSSFLTMVSRKSKTSIPSSGSTSSTAKTSSPPPPLSSSPSSNNNSSKNDKCSSHGNETDPSVFTVNPHKRQRESSHNPSFDKFPILDDELSTAAHMIRLTKRRKNHQSTSVAAVDQRSSSPTS